jgi:6,7-dimethyl-8-ribityllumazine synthase
MAAAAGSGTPRSLRGRTDAPHGRFAIVVSRFNDLITDKLAAGAEACLRQHGVAAGDIDVISVPGAWEIPFATAEAARRGGYTAVVAVGCVIRGETPHFEYVAGGAATGLGRITLETGVPIGFGVLTTDDAEQALARAGGAQGNKGWEAALAALELADLKRRIGADGEGT